MIDEMRTWSKKLLELRTSKKDVLSVMKSYLTLLKDALQKMNNMNYVNHFLYFSMLQLCNRINTVDPFLVMNLIKKLSLNSQTIYDGNQTILVIDDLIEKFEFSQKSINTTEIIDTQAPTKCDENRKKEITPTNHEPRTIIRPNFFVEVMPSLINFELLSHYRIGRISASLRAKKILKFKLKNYHHRKSIPIERKFKGRSEIAKNKKRIRGRFVRQKVKKIFSVK